MKKYTTVKSDILVAGGSGAAMEAAATAASMGMETVIVSRGKIGKSGNAFISSASVSMNTDLEELVIQSHYLCDQEIAKLYADEAGTAVRALISDIRKTGGSVFKRPTGFFTSGPSVCRALKSRITDSSIRKYEDIMVTDILHNGERACGAMGFDIRTGEIIVFIAKSVILATGGYQPFSFKSTCSDMTGDGPAAAYRAGCRLADMEFHLFIPSMLSPPDLRGSVFPFILHMSDMFSISILNNRGEDFMRDIPEELRRLSENSKWSKMIFAYYWQKEVDEGRGSPGGGIWFSMEKKPFIKTRTGIIKSSILLKRLYGSSWRYQGNDFSSIPSMIRENGRWEIGLSSEYSNGGILVNQDMRSDLPGLFAAGECAAGTFGALRIYEGLTEMLVHGRRAGRSAAEYAGVSGLCEPDSASLESAYSRISMHLDASRFSERESAASLTAALETAADNGMGLYIDEKGIRSSLETLNRIKDSASIGMYSVNSPGYFIGTVKALQLENLLVCTEAGIQASLRRKESRGMHIRKDFPSVDNINHLTRYTASSEDGSMKILQTAPVSVYFQPEKISYKSLMDFALETEKMRNRL